MTTKLLLAVLLFGMLVAAWDQAPLKGQRASSLYFELYSWPDTKDGVWNFSVFYNTNRQKSVKEVFAKKTVLRGLNSLKSKIAAMPSGAHIVWFDKLTLSGVAVKGSERLRRPPDEIVQEIKQYALEHGVELVGPPSK